MKLKGKTRPPANTGEPLLTLFQGGQGEDLDAVQVLEDGLVLHTNTLQKRRRYRRVELITGGSRTRGASGRCSTLLSGETLEKAEA